MHKNPCIPKGTECLLLAEAVEEVPGVRILETMIQNPGRY
jgi:hypothetical protein